MNEKEFILTSVLDCRCIDLYVDPPSLTTDQVEQIAIMEERCRQGEPLQYILGECEFMGLAFKVDPRVFIPRPETELLVEKAIRKAQTVTSRPVRILDIGTGSGNIAISLAAFVPDCAITAIDISSQALDLAKANATRHKVLHKIEFVQMSMVDFLNAFTPDENLFDIIVSNPPYIASEEMNQLPENVRCEPRIALDGGPGGGIYYRHIIEKSAQHLKKRGSLFLEMGDAQRGMIESLFTQSGQYEIVEIQKDFAQTDRIVVAQTVSSIKDVEKSWKK